MATVTPGSKLGVYEIVGAIGAGGMGTVYRARDTRLPRDAAIKVSAEKFTDRFAREAHAIASLNHPNITTLYDVGPDYLVMEMVEGPTLADRIKQGPLTLDEAAHVGKQIADALDYAHERGIVHRDLKPGNVKIRPDGVVKVLDFGLAKAGVGRMAPQSDESPTMTAHKTEAGVIVGTAAYMAPEQPGAKWLISRSISTYPRWRADGRQLFYVTNTLDVMAVDLDTSKTFQAGTPRRLLAAPPPLLNVGWDLGTDAKRLLFATTPNGGRTPAFTVVLNWAAGLKK